MSEVRYNVVVSGAILEGFELSQVIEEFAKLFQLGEAKAEKIFSQGNVTIKKNVEESTAKKFIVALENIGAAAHILPLDDEPSEDLSSNLGSEKSAEKEVETQPKMVAPTQNLQTATAEKSIQPFTFYGNGYEYFRIWIVNILLTIVTLGIYSAWAKVRNAQYFYGHTEVSGSRFAYLADPITILKGRIIAVLFFVAYSVVSNLFPIAGIVLSLILLIVLPWIVVRSLRFNRRMTAWRNIRFGFDGKIGEAVKAFILWPFLGVLTIGILMPLALYKQKEFIINNTRYGTAKFELSPCLKEFFMIFVYAVVVLFIAGIIAWVVGLLFAPISPLVIAIAYFYVFAYVSVRSANVLYNNSKIRQGNIGFHSFWEIVSYFKLIFFNSLFTLLTLGFFIPWAKVRTAIYKAEHLELVCNSDLDGFVAGEEEKISALGDEFGDVFDMEIGL